MASATSRRRAHRTTSVPASASTLANVVPHEPAPNTATRMSPIGFLGLGRHVELRRRRLVPQPGELLTHAGHEEVGHLTQQLVVDVTALEPRQVHRLGDVDLDLLAWE